MGLYLYCIEGSDFEFVGTKGYKCCNTIKIYLLAESEKDAIEKASKYNKRSIFKANRVNQIKFKINGNI